MPCAKHFRRKIPKEPQSMKFAFGSLMREPHAKSRQFKQKLKQPLCRLPDSLRRLASLVQGASFNQSNFMKITIEIPTATVEKIVRGIMDNYPEAGRTNTLKCERYNYTTLKFTFVDGETGKGYTLYKGNFIRTLPLVFGAKWPKGCTPAPTSPDWGQWEEWLCRCDVTEFDAFIQLACLGDVIYG